MKYLIGLMIVGVGFLMTWKPDWFVGMTGRIGAADSKLFSSFGGSRFFYQLLGIVLILGGTIVIFAKFDLSFISQPYQDL